MAIRYFLHHSAGTWSATAFLLLCAQTTVRAQVQMSAVALYAGRVRLSWQNTAGVYQLESAAGVNLQWSASGLPVQTAGDQSVVDLAASDSARFFRLKGSGGKPVTIASSSPGQNETG